MHKTNANVGGDHQYAFICCTVVDVVLCLEIFHHALDIRSDCLYVCVSVAIYFVAVISLFSVFSSVLFNLTCIFSQAVIFRWRYGVVKMLVFF